MYNLDWDTNNRRAQRIDIMDAANGAVLNSQTISRFKAGRYLVWNVSGHVKIKVTNTGKPDAVVSCVFFN
jgi:hypothetical protein